ncbi:MAG TPA: hypothetical protein VJB35_00715 [Candidatus Nanoarchaeia archaeon]|nr:hypothetical protein [Candidatus Nanoarchaeia archaeon]
MIKNDKYPNALIKRKRLVNLLKSFGINRVGSGVVDFLNENFENHFIILCQRFKEEMNVNGKKVLDVSDVKEVFDKMNYPEEKDY